MNKAISIKARKLPTVPVVLLKGRGLTHHSLAWFIFKLIQCHLPSVCVHTQDLKHNKITGEQER